MTSISGVGTGSRIQSLLQQQVAAGTIPSNDQSALSSAITDIGSQLRSGTATPGASMQDRVSGLIDNEVSSGKLTSDQASELKGLFSKAHAHMHHAHGGGGGGSAMNALFSTDGGSDPTDPTASTPTDPLTAIAGTAGSAVDSLASFVSKLRSSVSANSLYGAGGTPAGALGSLLINSFA